MEIIINSKYKLIDKIGEGAFGSIYKGQNIRTFSPVAIKIEPIQQQTNLLKNESKVLHFLNNIKGIPNLKWFGKDKTKYYMVINLLGESLQSVKTRYNLISLQHVLKIAIKIIILLRTIHEKGLIHRDIKPDNFLLGLNDKKNIYIIDFGFCKSYIKDNKHIPQKKIHNLIGSLNYASINSHKLIELSRRDDLESLGYMLLYFYLGELPWENEKNKEKIMYVKQNIVKNIKLPNVFINYMKYIWSLEFDENPNYTNIINNFMIEINNIEKNSLK
jgi:serine/threonine protein kinase